MYKKIVAVLLMCCMFSVAGCGGDKVSSDIKQAQEAVSAYESYQAGDISQDELAQKLLVISRTIEDQDLSMLVSNIVKDLAFADQTMFATEDPDEGVQELKDYIEKHK